MGIQAQVLTACVLLTLRGVPWVPVLLGGCAGPRVKQRFTSPSTSGWCVHPGLALVSVRAPREGTMPVREHVSASTRLKMRACHRMCTSQACAMVKSSASAA